MKRQCSDFDFFLLGLWNSLENLIKPYAHRIAERQEIMKTAQEKRTAPYEYLKTLKEIRPQNPDDWRAGDVLFLEHYRKDPELYQKLLQTRREYFNGQQH